MGSQAILATLPEDELPPLVTMSIEADIAFLGDDPVAKADRVDGAIGEGSQFHRTFGYYGQGVDPATAVLPVGWRKRAIRFVHGDTGSAAALCPEVHDLVASKLVAGREKDLAYARALSDAGVIDVEVLGERVGELPLLPGVRRRLAEIVGRLRRRR